MSKINWLVRIKNKNFWLAIIPAILLLVQAVAALFGHPIDCIEVYYYTPSDIVSKSGYLRAKYRVSPVNRQARINL